MLPTSLTPSLLPTKQNKTEPSLLKSSPCQLPHKLPQIPLRRILQILLERPLVLLAVSPLNADQQPSIPVQAHEARD
jgi:hypothetical protein